MTSEIGSFELPSADQLAPDITEATEDFGSWEQETNMNEISGEVTGALGRLSLDSVMNGEPDDDDLEEPKIDEDEEEKPKKIAPNEKNDDEGFDLMGEDMRQAALGFIYLTTGMPADEMID